MRQDLLLDRYLNFEKKNNLGCYVLENVHIWYYIRNIVYEKYIAKEAGIFKPAPKVLKKEKNRLKLRAKTNHLKDVDILFLNHRREKVSDDYYHCIYTQPIINKIENKYSYGIIEEPINKKDCNIIYDHYPNKNEENSIYLDNHSLLIQLTKPIINSYYRRKLATNKIILQIAELINAEFGDILEFNALRDLIIECIVFEKVHTKFVNRILAQTNPKILIEVLIPSFYRALVNKIAHQRNIPIVEIQHGLVGKYDPIFYQYYIKNEEYFPDKILTFGKYWNNRAKLPISYDNLYEVGFPYYEERLSKTKKVINSQKYILFISQGYVGKELSKFALKLSQELARRGNFDFEIIYKLHPFELNWQEVYPYLVDSPIKVVPHNEGDMYQYMADSVCQIGVYSTALFEGIGFDLRTFILSDYGSDELADLIGRYNCISYIDNMDNVIEEILAIKQGHNHSYDFKKVQEEIWKSNSITNIINFLEKNIK